MPVDIIILRRSIVFFTTYENIRIKRFFDISTIFSISFSLLFLKIISIFIYTFFPIYLADKFFYQPVDFIRLIRIGIMTGILYPFKR